VDLPVEQATQLELVLNLPTTFAFGVTVSPPLLARAHEVIK
jgi:putative ABC transport system substrate-binding protein